MVGKNMWGITDISMHNEYMSSLESNTSESKETNKYLKDISVSLNKQNTINLINFSCMLLLFGITIYNFILTKT